MGLSLILLSWNLVVESVEIILSECDFTTPAQIYEIAT
jgi:hypothetical protein